MARITVTAETRAVSVSRVDMRTVQASRDEYHFVRPGDGPFEIHIGREHSLIVREVQYGDPEQQV